jgi:hypothetical protein
LVVRVPYTAFSFWGQTQGDKATKSNH